MGIVYYRGSIWGSHSGEWQMSKTVLVISDQHAHPDHNNNRADWLGKYMKEVKPDIVVNIGDAADMPSLSGFDKGKASFVGNSYEKDIEAHLDFQERLWHPLRKGKRKRPRSVIMYGNHENRLKRVLEFQPELSGDKYGVSFKNFDFASYYDEQYPYEGSTPAVCTIDGVSFAHFFISGLMGRPIGGDHHAASLLAKNHTSSVCGHSPDYAIRSSTTGKKIMGLVTGVYQDYESGWAGSTNKLWWKGVTVLRNFEGGTFDPSFVSLEALRRAYG
jgi:predicted MPP superfamily phosphohydrolase